MLSSFPIALVSWTLILLFLLDDVFSYLIVNATIEDKKELVIETSLILIWCIWLDRSWRPSRIHLLLDQRYLPCQIPQKMVYEAVVFCCAACFCLFYPFSDSLSFSKYSGMHPWRSIFHRWGPYYICKWKPILWCESW